MFTKAATVRKGELNPEDVDLPYNEKIETIILRDLRMAYGLPVEVEGLVKLTMLRVFVLELNDLRGADRASFPVTILKFTRCLAELKNL